MTLERSLTLNMFGRSIDRAGPIALAVCLMFATAGCDTVLNRAVTVSDSAGVALVRSHRPQWTAETAWTVNPTPALDLEGPGPGRPFGRIAGMAVTGNGGLVVADGGDLTIHFFDGTGALVRSVRPGDAPVMPRTFTGVHRVGDEIRVTQRGLAPTLVFDAAGDFIRAIEPPAIDGFPFITHYREMPDGELLALQPPTGLLPRGDEWTEHARFIRIMPDGGTERVIDVPAVRFVRLPSAVEAVVYGPILGFAFLPDGVYAGFPDRWEITEYGEDGTVRRRIRRDWTPIAVTGADAAAVRERLLSMMTEDAGIPDDPELRKQPETQVRELKVADSLPAFGRLLVDSDGRLWVERVPPKPIILAGPFPVRDEPTPWDVFDPAGLWLGTVDTPADTHVMDIGAELVAGILETDGPDRAVVYRIER